jgi:hypothetical protein
LVDQEDRSMNAKFIAAGDLGDGRIQVFAVESGGQIRRRWTETADPTLG